MHLRYLVKMKRHISYFYNALLEYYPLHQAEWQTRWHNPLDWGLMSLVATCLVLWSAIQQRVYRTRVHDINELRQRLNTCLARLGAVADWWRSRPMTNVLTCLCLCQLRTFWTYFVTINSAKIIIKNRSRFSRVINQKCTATFYGSQCSLHLHRRNLRGYEGYHTRFLDWRYRTPTFQD